MPNVKISAVLLAGGESRRMGRDKATCEFRGKPLWHNQLAILQGLKPVEVFVSARTDPVWRPNDSIFVADEPPSRGPLSGIVAALNRMRGTHLLTLAIDLPSMTAKYLQTLCDQLAGGLGVVPMIKDRAEPLAAIYPIESIDILLAALNGIDYSLQTVVRKLAETNRVRMLPVSAANQELFRNLNSPDDLSSTRKARG